MEEKAQRGAEADFIAYGIPLTLITPFKYIRRVLLAADSDCPEQVINLQKKWQK